jgi:hypothetical protein
MSHWTWVVVELFFAYFMSCGGSAHIAVLAFGEIAVAE